MRGIKEKIMKKKLKHKDFIISIIGRDLRKTPEPEEKRKEDLQESSDKTRRGDLPRSPDNARKNDLPRSPSSGKSQMKKNKTHYRVEYTKDGPKFWTLH